MMGTAIHAPKNDRPADFLYVFLSRDPDGTEGIVASQIGGILCPMVFMEAAKLDLFQVLVDDLVKRTGKTVTRAKFARVL